MRRRNFFPHLAYNWISGVGAVLASVAFLTAVMLLAFSIFVGLPSPYFGIVIYLLLPMIVVLGLLLIPLGMWRRHRRLLRGVAEEHPHWPCVDFNKRGVRNGAIIFGIGTVLFMLLSSVTTYRGYQYTESTKFCGLTCHTVMEPEYTAHQISPHAVVTCTSCHVGPGVGWYAKSKIRGVDRVFEVALNNYPTPIPVPLSDLMPEELECHKCHWPKTFFGGRRWVFHNYLYDEKNTHWPVDMVIHTGGGDPSVDQTGGIHWYMYVGYQIEFIARDKHRQDIPWVRATNRKTGEVTVYEDQTNPLSKEEIASRRPHRIECIDCHNRTGHMLEAPDDAVDRAIHIGKIDQTLPNIKKTAVAALAVSYDNSSQALTAVDAAITKYYQSDYPKIYREKKNSIEQAVHATQQIYSRSIFPLMKADWQAYPSNLGHSYSLGCFRCHLGRHQSKDGRKIPHDCSTCHDILAQGSGKDAEIASTREGLTFKHPVDIGGLWKQMACSECHTGKVIAFPATPQAPSSPVPAKPAPEEKLPTLSAAQKTQVKQVYDQLCITCHGPQGKGVAPIRLAMPKLPDLTDPQWQSAHSNAEMQDVILNGKGKMPGAKGNLGSVQPQEMVAYVRQLKSATKPSATK